MGYSVLNLRRHWERTHLTNYVLMDTNSTFFGLLSILLGALISGYFAVNPQQQKGMNYTLLSVSGGVATAWIGFALGKNQGKKEGARLSSIPESPAPSNSGHGKLEFTVVTPKDGAEISETCTVEGVFKNLPDKDENSIWLYVDNGETYFPSAVKAFDRGKNTWRVNNVSFDKKANSQEQKVEFKVQVVRAEAEACNAFFAGKSKGLPHLPGGIEDISERVSFYRVFF
jgi:hypothetical protein